MKRVPVVLSIMLGLAVVAPLAASPSASAQDATPAACATTSEEENVALITQHLQAVAAGDDVSSWIAPERTTHLPSGEDIVVTGPTSDWAAERDADYAQEAVIVEHVIAQDDMVAAYVTWSGTHQGELEELGVPATGRDAEWVGTTFFRIECGKIAEIWPVGDQLGQLMDLGVITPEELASAEDVATPAP